MPFIRITRDKRGYESTFVMHIARVHGRKRSRVLYWFRTPPGVRVGRSALDAEAIRAIEDSHPDIPFDWTTMLQQRVVTESAPPPRVPSAKGDQKAASVNEAEMAASTAERDASQAKVPALEQLVGSEGVARLRARFADLQARIADERAALSPEWNIDDLRREAEALDPDAWVTVDEARGGLETFEAAFEALQRKLPRRKRRGRRGDRTRSEPEQAIQSHGPKPPPKSGEDDGGQGPASGV